MKKILCVILLSVILVAFCSCGVELNEQSEDIVELYAWFFTSGVPNNEIKVKHSDENAKFELRVDFGKFWVEEPQAYMQTATLNNGDTVYWHQDIEHNVAYVDVIAKVDNNIVGYAVIKITKKENSFDYNAEILKSAVFPKVDDNYQQVTSKQVEEKIKSVKK